MKRITAQDIQQWEARYRVTFIHSLAGYKQPVLVGTRSLSGTSNLAVFNSLMHIGANPPLYGLLFRPDTVRRDTLRNVVESGEYTLNWMSAKDVEAVHQTAAKYPAEESEFVAVGYTERSDAGACSPRVAEAVISARLRLAQIIDIPLNGTKLVIGSVEEIYIPEDVVSGEGFVALHQLDVLSSVGLDAYYRPQPLIRFSYPRPGEQLKAIPFTDKGEARI